MRIVWGSKYEERAIMPTFFAILFDIFFMCSFQVKCWSTYIPRNLVVITCAIGTPFITSDICLAKGILFLCDLKIMKFVFSKLRVSLFAQNQSATSDNFSFTVLNRESNDLWEWKTFVSSAKRIKNKVEDTLGRSLM